MKLRCRGNALRLRVNRREVEELASGGRIEEAVVFPNDSRFRYVLEPTGGRDPRAYFDGETILVTAPHWQVQAWARGEELGLYFDVGADHSILKVSIEKDLECVDGPAEERDPDAFPRLAHSNC